MELVLIRGLPGSGKSTLARKYAEVGYVHLEADHFFTDGDGNYRFNPRDISLAHSWCQTAAQEAMDDGKSVVVANTFTEYWEMANYFLAAKERSVKVVVIEATGMWENIHGVPEVALKRMRDRWQPYQMDWGK